MYIWHNHFENSVSGACSNVNVFDTYDWVFDDMIDSVRTTISHCEFETIKLIQWFLKTGIDNECEIDWFIVSIEEDWNGYYITTKDKQDMYHYRIIDIDKWEYESSF